MKIISENNNIIIESCFNFDLEQIFDCGQCFRFEKNDDGTFTGVALGRKISLKQNGDSITIYDMDEEEFGIKWRSYFDLDRDYGEIIKELSFDSRIKIAAARTGGIRILRQECWETLCSFIISQNNNIPRIKKIIASLCRSLGDAVEVGVYTFPSAEKIAEAGLEGLEPIKSGFRAKYILDAAQKVASGEIDFKMIAGLSYNEAKSKLKTIKGVGDKVADCVLLFGFGFYEAFPVDVWVKKVITNYYGEGFTPEYFGKNAGIAQQYLFYYERSFSKSENIQQKSIK
jgi:N-glycosylase/DNA lyase